MSKTAPNPHSAIVKAWLLVNGLRIPLCNVGPNFCYADNPPELPDDAIGVLELRVDGSPIEWNVRLPYGSLPFENRIEFEIGPKQRPFIDSAEELPERVEFRFGEG